MQKRNKLLIGGLSTAAVVTGVALTGGTSAYYYDLETIQGNQFAACGFDLGYAITGSETPGSGSTEPETDAIVSADGVIEIANIEPGDTFQVDVTLTNGPEACAGDLWVDIDQHVDSENGLTEPEEAVGDDGSAGELGNYLLVDLSLDTIQVYNDTPLAAVGVAWPASIDDNFTAGESHTFSANITAPESGDPGAENEIMTDTYTFDLDFALAQRGYMPAGTPDLSEEPSDVDLPDLPGSP